MPAKQLEISLNRLNAVRILIVLMIALGYASTMPVGPGNRELFAQFGYDPSWIGIHLLFFLSGFLALRSIRKHGSAFAYLKSRAVRNLPLLAVFTLIVVAIIYPLLGVASDNPATTFSKLGKYFILTVTCIDPGQPLPGLLDDAKYMCMIQGAVWTFKWGLIAHLATAIGAKLKLFDSDRFVLILAITSAIGHFTVSYILAKNGYSWLENPALALRLGAPFLAGMACFAYFDKLPRATLTRALILTGFFGAAILSYNAPWTPAIEMFVTAFWAYAALLLATSTTPALKVFDQWPNLALGIYLANWPTAQLLLLALPDISRWGLVGLTLPLSVLLAAIAHTLISQPLAKSKNIKTKPLTS